ncbi:MAG: GH32 C-terminal domain-containing protein [Woeseiaceae bacterium]
MTTKFDAADTGAIKEMLAAYASAIDSADIDALGEVYSDDWKSAKDISKTQMLDHYKRSSGLNVLFNSAELKFDDDGATISPVSISSPKGTVTFRHTMRKESDGAWRICHSETIDWESIEMDGEQKARKAEFDEAAMAARELREKILSDPARPGYHFVMPEGIATPFDPNGAIYWKGRYHLFYIFQDRRSGKKKDHWGHVSSTDLFHWRHHPTGLLDGMYSGNCFINGDGVPTICYHQVDQGNAMAVALDDDLNEWQKLASNPITPKTEEGDEHHGKYRSWDPFGWLEGDTYYAIFGGKHPAVAKAPALSGEWQYVGDLFAHGVDGVPLDEDVSCAELFKLGGKDVLLCISHTLGCRYYIGEWKDEQFYPEVHRQMSWTDNMFFAPESLLDDQGRRIMWAWLMDYREFGIRWDRAWSGTMSLPRVLSLDEDGEMLFDVPAEIEALRYDARSLSDIALQAGSDFVVDDLRGNSMELYIEMESADATEFGVKVCVSPDGVEETIIAYDVAAGALKIDAEKSGPDDAAKSVEAGPFELRDGERLQLRVFVDKSVIEVFANRRQAVVRRIYPAHEDSLGVSLFATGGPVQVHTLESWKISPSNPF